MEMVAPAFLSALLSDNPEKINRVNHMDSLPGFFVSHVALCDPSQKCMNHSTACKLVWDPHSTAFLVATIKSQSGKPLPGLKADVVKMRIHRGKRPNFKSGKS
jgi:hypothetical protein